MGYKSDFIKSPKRMANQLGRQIMKARTYEEVRTLAQGLWSLPLGSDDRETVYLAIVVRTNELNIARGMSVFKMFTLQDEVNVPGSGRSGGGGSAIWM